MPGKTLPEAIDDTLLRTGWSLETLARALQRHPKTIGNWRAGKHGPKSAETREYLVRKLAALAASGSNPSDTGLKESVSFTPEKPVGSTRAVVASRTTVGEIGELRGQMRALQQTVVDLTLLVGKLQGAVEQLSERVDRCTEKCS